jgi:hypothetical protein
MDEIDGNLIEAWGKVFVRLRDDPAEARRRWLRVAEGMYGKPVRPWCLKLRSSDMRIAERGDMVIETEAAEAKQAHRVVITGRALRELCAPVRIKWPGVPQGEAARLLGRHRNALDKWIPVKAGRTRAERKRQQPRRWEEVREPGFPLGVRYEAPKPFHHWGYDVPVVWSDRALDPQASRGQSPHPIWGSLWQTLAERIPEAFEQVVERVPHSRVRLGKTEHRGWRWRCPGLAGVGCGREVRVLFAPLPVWGIAQALGVDEGLNIEAQSDEGVLRVAGQWQPGWYDPWAGRRQLACEKCWGIQGTSMATYRGWNDLVSYLSGGLLYGREVAKPDWVKYERKQVRRERRVMGEDVAVREEGVEVGRVA